MIAHHALGPGMNVIGALGLASLCLECIAARAGLSVFAVLDELVEMNAARQRRDRPPLGPIQAHCQRCEAARPVYRLRPGSPSA
jgi:hypothetical protein